MYNYNNVQSIDQYYSSMQLLILFCEINYQDHEYEGYQGMRIAPSIWVFEISTFDNSHIFMGINIENKCWIVLCLLEKISLLNSPISNDRWVKKIWEKYWARVTDP